jgi:nuclease-like protein
MASRLSCSWEVSQFSRSACHEDGDVARTFGLGSTVKWQPERNSISSCCCRVFHDVRAEGFNIDHVVIGAAGVFAVETKARPKRPHGTGSQGATVTYDGSVLHFPGWQEREPLEHAKSRAEWLRRWLTSAVGEPVDVKPVLALPGWFVDRKASGDVIVINPKNATFLATRRGGHELAAQIIQRLAHQLEQRCRDMAPLAFCDLRQDS